MKANVMFFRRLLLVCSALLVIAALIVALGVIPRINADTDPSIDHAKVTAAFWVNIGLALLSAISLFIIFIRASERSWKSTSVLIIAGLIAVLLGLALADAASAYRNDSHPLHAASIFLFICAVVDFLAGVVIIASAFLRPKKV